ncbi:hypothetical protein LCGC14_0774150 [marine sediment metagenome]|uniref:Major capsid protein n=1 Tax=marine sediment metagenome TaxID=412755 RepID=A0A0F9QHA8_9ZZZZ
MATGATGSAWAGTEEVGTKGLRTEVVNKVIKGRADATYKFKQAVTIVRTSAWRNQFFREDPDILDDPDGNSVKGIPRGGNFPQAVVQWEKIDSYLEKYGLEAYILFEDERTNDINTIKRTLFRITERVIKSVDDEIWAKLSEADENGNPITQVDIQSVTLGAGDGKWDQASAAILDNIGMGRQLIAEKNYDTSNLLLYVNPKDHRSIVNYMAEKGAQWTSVGEDMIKNGRTRKIGGVQLVLSNSVAISYALMVIPKVCGNWVENLALQSDLQKEAFKGTRVRVAEIGVTQVTDPKTCVIFKNTAVDAI